MKPIYLDYNATTPIDPEVAAAMQPYLLEHFGNPSSSHWYGQHTTQAVATARQQVADLLQCDPDEVIFTSGGSESNNYAIKGTALAHRERGHHIITSAIEHPAVIEVCKYLETQGFEVTYLAEGAGIMALVTRVLLSTDAGNPQSVIAKFPSPSADNRAVASTYSMYQREVQFYDSIAAHVEMRMPRCFCSPSSVNVVLASGSCLSTAYLPLFQPCTKI